MKSMFICLILLFTSTIKGYTNPSDVLAEYEIIPIQDLNKIKDFEKYKDLSDDQKINEIMKNWDKNWAIEVNKGLELPINPRIEGEFFHLNPDQKEIWISVDKSFYIRLEDENFLFSIDLKTWQSADKFFTGLIGISYSCSSDDKFSLGFIAECNKR